MYARIGMHMSSVMQSPGLFFNKCRTPFQDSSTLRSSNPRSPSGPLSASGLWRTLRCRLLLGSAGIALVPVVQQWSVVFVLLLGRNNEHLQCHWQISAILSPFCVCGAMGGNQQDGSGVDEKEEVGSKDSVAAVSEKALESWLKERREREELRQQHVEAPKNRPNRAFFKTLDGSVKKTTAFVKKIKSSLTEQQRQSVLTDFEKTNLSRFLSEVATTLAEAGLTKNVDLQTALALASEMHKRYADFAEVFADVLTSRLKIPEPDDKNAMIQFEYGVTSTHTHTHTSMSTRIPLNGHTRTHTHACTKHTSTHKHMHKHIRKHTHTHTHTSRSTRIPLNGHTCTRTLAFCCVLLICAGSLSSCTLTRRCCASWTNTRPRYVLSPI